MAPQSEPRDGSHNAHGKMSPSREESALGRCSGKWGPWRRVPGEKYSFLQEFEHLLCAGCYSGYLEHPSDQTINSPTFKDLNSKACNVNQQ
jgi:hypothetical protein